MSNCSNCFNGCAEIVSDQCVKYTGVDVPLLGIKTGDSLSYVEQALISFLSSTLDGTGIIINVPQNTICTLVKDNLPTCGDLTVEALINALIKSVCDLQEQIDAISGEITQIEGEYDVECLTGVVPLSGTHNILQAVISKLCTVEANLAALALNVSTNYVKLSELNSLIAAYIASTSTSTQQYTKMVPYTVVEYYGSLTNFDGSGKGLASAGFDKIYLCNGLNGTPDKRGRVGVGVVAGISGGPLSPDVDPAIPGNPNYTLKMTTGVNSVALKISELPSHTHTATVTDPGHFTRIKIAPSTSTDWPSTTGSSSPITQVESYQSSSSGTITTVTTTTKDFTDITVTNLATGNGAGHNNIQPVLACYYIMYIP